MTWRCFPCDMRPTRSRTATTRTQLAGAGQRGKSRTGGPFRHSPSQDVERALLQGLHARHARGGPGLGPVCSRGCSPGAPRLRRRCFGAMRPWRHANSLFSLRIREDHRLRSVRAADHSWLGMVGKCCSEVTCLPIREHCALLLIEEKDRNLRSPHSCSAQVVPLTLRYTSTPRA